MKKVITYGTYDLLHYGHIKLLERAKNLGDYLIVGVTSSDFDKKRGKINVQQSLMERVKAIKDTGLADEIIVEEYEGQKIEDIIKYGIDIFAIGSDWEGKFDYLKEYCEVIYLSRTEGISSTNLRSKEKRIRIGLVGSGDGMTLEKFYNECNFVNGVEVTSILNIKNITKFNNIANYETYEELISNVDAVYILEEPNLHYDKIKYALNNHKHVLCESPVTINKEQYNELKTLAKKTNCILMESIKTAYTTAYIRLLLLVKMGIIGDIISIDSVCTSLRDIEEEYKNNSWNSICSWGPTALLPVLQILGTEYKKMEITSKCIDDKKSFDIFTKINFIYNNSVASIKVGKGVKSEGELIISGTKGYIYVPAPWWKTDYFEVRYENSSENKRYFYSLEGEGIRNEILSFSRAIFGCNEVSNIRSNVTEEICNIINEFYINKIDL